MVYYHLPPPCVFRPAPLQATGRALNYARNVWSSPEFLSPKAKLPDFAWHWTGRYPRRYFEGIQKLRPDLVEIVWDSVTVNTDTISINRKISWLNSHTLRLPCLNLQSIGDAGLLVEGLTNLDRRMEAYSWGFYLLSRV